MHKIQNIQALRGVAALLVVLFHLVLIEQKYGGSKNVLPSLLQFGTFGVDLFFVISGFVMVAVTRDKFRNMQYALHFIYRRASRIYPTYWVYTILVLIVFLVHPSWVNRSQGHQADILASFLLLPSQTLPLVMVGWTLIHEIYFYLMFFFMLWLIPEQKMPYALAVWAGCILLVNIWVPLNNPYARLISHPLTIEFVGGCFLGIHYFKRDRRFNARFLLVMAGCLLMASLYGYHCYHSITGEIAPLSWWRVLIFGLPAIGIVLCMIHVETKGLVAPASLIKIGDASYSIYLSHVLTISAVGRFWHLFSFEGIYDNIIVIPIMFITVIIIGKLGYIWVEKPLLNMSRKLA